MKNEEEQMAHNGLNGLTQKQTSVEFLYQKMFENQGRILKEDYEQAKEMEIKQAHEYAKFAIICDRKDIKILNFDGYINLKNTEQ